MKRSHDFLRGTRSFYEIVASEIANLRVGDSTSFLSRTCTFQSHVRHGPWPFVGRWPRGEDTVAMTDAALDLGVYSFFSFFDDQTQNRTAQNRTELELIHRLGIFCSLR